MTDTKQVKAKQRRVVKESVIADTSEAYKEMPMTTLAFFMATQMGDCKSQPVEVIKSRAKRALENALIMNEHYAKYMKGKENA